jgi:hypothetical protein
VVEVGRRAGLPPEALDEGAVGGELGEEDLEGHGPVEQQVAGEIDLGHAAAGEVPHDLVAAGEDLGGHAKSLGGHCH